MGWCLVGLLSLFVALRFLSCCFSRPGNLDDIFWRFGDGNRLFEYITRIFDSPEINYNHESSCSERDKLTIANDIINLRHEIRAMEKQLFKIQPESMDRPISTLEEKSQVGKNIAWGWNPHTSQVKLNELRLKARTLRKAFGENRDNPALRRFPKPLGHANLSTIYRRLKFIKKTQGHFLFVFCVCIDPQEEFIATGSDDTLIKLWSASSGALLKSLRGHAPMFAIFA